MRQVAARDLLQGWETMRSQPMPVRAAALAALATGHPLDEVMRWSIPRRDVALFAWHAEVFGENLDAVVQCPRCTEALEMPIALHEIRPARVDVAASPHRVVRIGGRRVRYRFPTTEDLLALESLSDPGTARATLLARCVQTTDVDLRERVAARLPDDPTDVHLHLTCPACGHAWHAAFDITAFTWHELGDWARRTLHDIHTIASAYGWSEDEILALSHERRRAYVELIG